MRRKENFRPVATALAGPRFLHHWPGHSALYPHSVFDRTRCAAQTHCAYNACLTETLTSYATVPRSGGWLRDQCNFVLSAWLSSQTLRLVNMFHPQARKPCKYVVLRGQTALFLFVNIGVATRDQKLQKTCTPISSTWSPVISRTDQYCWVFHYNAMRHVHTSILYSYIYNIQWMINNILSSTSYMEP